MARIETGSVDGLTLPRERDQVRALFEMRWRLFVRNMRRDEEKVSFVLWVTGRILVFLFSIGLGALGALVTYVAYRQMDSAVTPIFNFVLIGWQVMALLRGALPHGVEAELLRFPLRFRTYVALWLSAGAFEGLTMVGTWICIGLFVGLVLGGAGVLRSVVTVLLFFLCNLFLSRASFLWLSRALAKRKWRDLMLVVGSALGAVPALMRSQSHWLATMAQRIALPPWLSGALRYTPGYLAGHAVRGAWQPMLWLAVWDAVFCMALLRGLSRAFRGDDIHEFAAAASKPMRARKARSDGGASAGSPVLAVANLEWLKLRHGGLAIYQTAAPLLYVVIFGIRIAHGAIGVWAVPAAAAYVSLGFRAHNLLGAEGAGVQTYLLLPVPIRTVLLGKNLFAVLLYLGQAVAAALVLIVATGNVSAEAMLFTLLWMVTYACVCMAIGNRRSLTSPTFVQTDKLTVRDARRAQRGSGTWIAFGAMLGLVALGAMIIALCVRLQHTGWTVWMMLPFSVAAVWFYRRSLDDPHFRGDVAATELLLTRVAKAA